MKNSKMPLKFDFVRNWPWKSHFLEWSNVSLGTWKVTFSNLIQLIEFSLTSVSWLELFWGKILRFSFLIILTFLIGKLDHVMGSSIFKCSTFYFELEIVQRQRCKFQTYIFTWCSSCFRLRKIFESISSKMHGGKIETPNSNQA